MLTYKQVNAYTNFFGNIIAFIPFGVFLPVLFRKTMSLFHVLTFSSLPSLGFELTQLVCSIGTFDVDDVLLNSTGGTLGYILFQLSARLFADTTDQVKQKRIDRIPAAET